MPGVGHKTDPDFLIVGQRFSLCLYAPYTIMTPLQKPYLLESDSIGHGQTRMTRKNHEKVYR